METNFGFRRDDNPSNVGKVPAIVKVGATDAFNAHVYGHSWEGFWTHWNGERTVPCREDKKLCTLCVKLLAQRWAGFLHIGTPGHGPGGFLELTLGARDALKSLLAHRTSFRGAILYVSRLRKQRKAPLDFCYIGEHQGIPEMPPALTVLPTLKRVWGFEERT